MTKTQGTATVGEAVLFDGNTLLIVNNTKRWSQERDEPVDLVDLENVDWKVTVALEDIRWDDELGMWYLWGRALRKADRGVVAELRDRGLLPARRTRAPGSRPAGGEHLNLYKALFSGSVDWSAELGNVRAGEDVSDSAAAALADYKVKFAQPLVEGYADPDADDGEAM